MGLWGGQAELKLVKSYLPPFACPIMQSTLEFGLNDTYHGLSAVIIPAICDTLRCMTQNWRFGVTSIPMIPIVYPQNRTSPASVDYLISEYENVLVMLATITGNMMSEKSLCAAIDIYNRHNAVMRQFNQIANDHLDIITPKVRHAVNKSALFFDKKEHTQIVESIIEQLNQLPVHPYQESASFLPESPASRTLYWISLKKIISPLWPMTWHRKAANFEQTSRKKGRWSQAPGPAVEGTPRMQLDPRTGQATRSYAGQDVPGVSGRRRD